MWVSKWIEISFPDSEERLKDSFQSAETIAIQLLEVNSEKNQVTTIKKLQTK